MTVAGCCKVTLVCEFLDCGSQLWRERDWIEATTLLLWSNRAKRFGLLTSFHPFSYLKMICGCCEAEYRWNAVHYSVCNFSHFLHPQPWAAALRVSRLNWFLGKFTSNLLVRALLEEIWIMAKTHHFLLCLMTFKPGVLYLRDGQTNRRPILPAPVTGRSILFLLIAATIYCCSFVCCC